MYIAAVAAAEAVGVAGVASVGRSEKRRERAAMRVEERGNVPRRKLERQVLLQFSLLDIPLTHVCCFLAPPPPLILPLYFECADVVWGALVVFGGWDQANSICGDVQMLLVSPAGVRWCALNIPGVRSHADHPQT